MFLSFDAPLTNRDFVSVVIISFRRPQYLRNLLESIHRHADMPFEIIVHDDASGPALEAEILNSCRGLASTFVLGSPAGINMGFASSANRAIALANSEYILFLNDDVEMLGPAFRYLKRVLDLPFMGCFGPWPVKQVEPGTIDVVSTSYPTSAVPFSSGELSFYLTPMPGGSGMFAFRKSLWQQVGGFPQVYTNAGDTGFMVRCIQNGYFAGAHPLNVPEMFTNVDYVAGYPNPSAHKTSFDSSYPHVFGVPNLPELCMQRKSRIYDYSHHNYYCPEGIVNHNWIIQYFAEARLDNACGYDWEKFKYNQAVWRQEIDAGLQAWRGLA